MLWPNSIFDARSQSYVVKFITFQLIGANHYLQIRFNFAYGIPRNELELKLAALKTQ